MAQVMCQSAALCGDRRCGGPEGNPAARPEGAPQHPTDICLTRNGEVKRWLSVGLQTLIIQQRWFTAGSGLSLINRGSPHSKDRGFQKPSEAGLQSVYEIFDVSAIYIVGLRGYKNTDLIACLNNWKHGSSMLVLSNALLKEVCFCSGQKPMLLWGRKSVCAREMEAMGGNTQLRRGGLRGRGVRVCAIEQPPVMRGSMLTRMVSNTAWGNSSFTLLLKPSSLFCLPSSVNISLSPGTDSGVNRNQIMHTNISVTQNVEQPLFTNSSICLSFFNPTSDYSTDFPSVLQNCVHVRWLFM